MQHPETSLVIAAHPDDIETQLGYLSAETSRNSRIAALVLTDGTASSVNHTTDPCFCR